MKRIFFITGLIVSMHAFAENVDPYDTDAQYGWAENVGWLNAEPDIGVGMQVESNRVTGWVWGENIGWINLHCVNNGTCSTGRYGVINDGTGNLSGYAWGENIGWINFDPVVSGPGDAYRVTIDAEGTMTGWAWGENIGWIHFDGTQTWSVQVCIVTLDDLANFAADWLVVGSVPANLDKIGDVDMADFDLFAEKWLAYCPDGWALK